jgi:hypothetical protein
MSGQRQHEPSFSSPPPTKLLQHLVTLVQNKHLDGRSVQGLVSNQSVQSTRSSDDNVRALGLVLQDLLVLLDRGSTVKDTRLDVGHVLCETGKLVLDLEGQFSGVTENDARDLAVDGLELLQGRENKDGGLTHTRLGLAEDVLTQDGLRDTLLLDCRFRKSRRRE